MRSIKLTVVMVVAMTFPVVGGQTSRISVTTNGAEGDGASDTFSQAVSADGQIVVFHSRATDLVEDDDNGLADVFVRDLAAGTTTRISVGLLGAETNGDSLAPSVSADGQRVVFHSFADNLVDGDDNEAADVFLYNRQDGSIVRVSVDSAGQEGDDDSKFGVISGDGSVVVFQSEATNLVDDDTNVHEDIFVRDLQAQTTELATVSSTGAQADFDSNVAAVSYDGRLVAFQSFATNLVDDDTNNTLDVFARDRDAQTTLRVSVADNGDEADGYSYLGNMSADGRYVVFLSIAGNLVDNDDNGFSDVFVRDRDAQTTARISIGLGNQPTDDYCTAAVISSDGQYVAFDSFATNIVNNDTNAAADVFVWQRSDGAITRVSVSETGGQAGKSSLVSAISADGRYVVFDSDATDLVGDDGNGKRDCFIHDRASAKSADLDGDGDVDVGDYCLLAAAYSGPGIPPGDPAADLDNDNDCDLNDFELFVAELTGP